jgi:hypothetical protein
MAMEIINGFQCKNCTDVDYARKHIDPAHPKDGPFGVDNPGKLAKAAHDKAIKFGGSLIDPDAEPRDPFTRPQPLAHANATGRLVNLTA